jgi:hypothetical protein
VTAAPRLLKPKAAHAPAPRTVSVTGSGDFAGWQLTARADFPAQVMFDLELSDASKADDLRRVFTTFDRLIISHNLPDMDGNVAERLADVDPKEGAVLMLGEALTAISRLPPR